VADDGRGLRVEGVEHADHVADVVQLRVGVDVLGLVGLAVAAHVRRDDVVAGGREHRQLVAPRVPALREAVAEQHQRRARVARLDVVHLDAVGGQGAVAQVGHGSRLLGRRADGCPRGGSSSGRGRL
jgi:1,6-anhydro-N-acetylmuramate kinase